MTAPAPDSEITPEPPHQSVLLHETIAALNLSPGQCMVDCTLGAGGHSAALLERISPGGWLIGLDADPSALVLARERLEPLAREKSVRLEFVHSNFNRLPAALSALAAPPPQGILADLGVSSMHLDQPERGFSFRFDAPLDMRMDPTLPRTAADILQESNEEDLADILYLLGEERQSRRIARSIVYERQREPIRTTGQLEALVRRALRVREHRRVHPATKTFQALRMAVNQELEALDAFLQDAPEALAPGGVLAVISFHSLEDRRVKLRFKKLARTGRFQQTVKLDRADSDETRENPRSRSAKLRAIRKD